MSGALLVRSYGQEEWETERFRERSDALMNVEIHRNLVGRWFFMFLGVVSAAAPALIYWYGGREVMGGTMTLGGMIAFIAYQGRLFGPITSLLNIHVDLASALALFERIFEYLDLSPELEDAPDATPLPPVRGKIAFRDVVFSYVSKLPVLQGVSFHVAPGQMAALVGPSGAGKSTILAPAAEAVRRGRRRRGDRRLGRAAGDAGVAALPDRDRHAGRVPAERHAAGQPALRPAGCDGAGDARGGGSGAAGGGCGGAARELRHGGGGARLPGSPGARASGWPSRGRC